MRGKIFNNRPLFSLLFAGNFCGEVLIDGRQSREMGGSTSSPPPPTTENPGSCGNMLRVISRVTIQRKLKFVCRIISYYFLIKSGTKFATSC